MPHPAIALTMIAALIAALLVYRQFLIVMMDVFGLGFAALAIAVCYILACRIHRRESGY